MVKSNLSLSLSLSIYLYFSPVRIAAFKMFYFYYQVIKLQPRVCCQMSYGYQGRVFVAGRRRPNDSQGVGHNKAYFIRGHALRVVTFQASKAVKN